MATDFTSLNEFFPYFSTFYLHDQNRIVPIREFPGLSKQTCHHRTEKLSSSTGDISTSEKHHGRGAGQGNGRARIQCSNSYTGQTFEKPKDETDGVLGANFGMSRNQMNYQSFLPSWMKHETLKLTHESWIPLFGGPSVAHRSTWTWLDSCSQDWKWKDQRQLGEDSMRYIISFGDVWISDIQKIPRALSINHSQTLYEATWPCSIVLSARLFASSDGSHCQTRSLQEPWEAQNWTWCWDQGSLNLLIYFITFSSTPFWSPVSIVSWPAYIL